MTNPHRLAVARLWYEANSFNPLAQPLAAFQAREWVKGPQAAALYTDTATEMGAVLAFANLNPDWQVEYLRCTSAPPGGPVAQQGLDRVLDEIVTGIEAGSWDAIYLSLHGALIGTTDLCPDHTLLARIRAAIGPDVAFAVGTATAVREGAGVQAAYKGAPIMSFTGDGGFGFSGFELETQARYRLPVVNILYSNNAWGTWTGAASSPIHLPIHLMQENLRYDKLAEGLGAHGEYVNQPSQFLPALQRAWAIAENESRPSLIVCQGKKEFWDRSLYEPGFLGKVEPGVMAYYH